MCGIRRRRSSSTSRKPGGRDERGHARRGARARRSSRRSCRGRRSSTVPASRGEPGDRLDDRPVVVRRRREQLAHRRGPVRRTWRITSVNVPPTSTPIRESSVGRSCMYRRDMKFQIAIAAEHTANCRRNGRPGLDDRSQPLEDRESIEQRVARHAARPDRQRPAAGGDAARAARPRAAARRLADAGARSGSAELEREGLVEVGDTGRALVSRLTREDFEEIYAARLGLEGLAARVGAVGGRAGRDRRGCAACSASSAGSPSEQDVDGVPRSSAGSSTPICYRPRGRPRLVAEVERLFWRAERYNHLVLSTPERFRRSVGLLPRVPRRLRGAATPTAPSA